ncbi:potassium/proton antiporter [Deinococcus maricopensis]|uniref:Sodium/hydrogen exchanger n=1 Tax=Deinococcus maricopensis (strain DSM 21211 / LMG 22137 / NRRL B-23946 / LB-34) TaxID=709986 RepID=E8UAR4_DEIML|nr:potassium/proton antiporter [Deinococcus maricopensis]ADV68153.1 sodium/hydrogen exchanger [Deinococcus maricopensis DSM 21211]
MNSATLILVSGALLFLSLLASKVGGRLGLPGLLLFLIIGMLAGSDGFGGIHFDNYALTQFVGVVALAFILFTGGLETDWRTAKPVLWSSISLATLGVLITTALVGLAAHALIGLPLLPALLLGAIVAPTDASAVFSVLKERALGLKGRIRPLLEFESGINDPTAVVLVIGLTELIQHPGTPPLSLLTEFLQEMVLGGVIGYVAGRVAVPIINRINLPLDGLYSVLTVALVAIIYGATAAVHGSGFLAVYIAGVVLGNARFIHKRSLRHFHEGLTYLLEVGMFLLLGLLVFPSQLPGIAVPALLLALVLVFAARPLAVYVSLLGVRMPIAHKTMVAWVGLRGAVPVVLATFPLLAGVPGAQDLFNVAFFLVLVSILVQGTSLPFVARWLRVNVPLEDTVNMPLEYTPTGAGRNDFLEITVPADSYVVGQRIVDLGLPPEALIVMLRRNDEYMIPRGSTTLLAGDVLQVLAGRPHADPVRALVAKRQG